MPQSAVDGIAPTTFVKMGGGRGLFPESLSPAGLFPFGGGMYYDGYGYLGGKGSFGAVIVEYLSN